MLRRWSAALAATALIMTAGAAEASFTTKRDWPDGTRMALTFDHRETLKRGSWVRDESGHRHRGQVLTQDAGRIRVTKGIVRRGADFPNRCRGCGRAIIQVADARGLDPRARNFVYGAAVRIGKAQAARRSNVLQKGYYKQAGGQYKLQLLAGGRPSCVVNGRLGRVIVTAAGSVANDRWHRLSCTRTATGVALRVDGKIRARRSGSTGFVNNTSPIRIGAKKVGTANSQFPGRLDSAFLRVVVG